MCICFRLIDISRFKTNDGLSNENNEEEGTTIKANFGPMQPFSDLIVLI